MIPIKLRPDSHYACLWSWNGVTLFDLLHWGWGSVFQLPLCKVFLILFKGQDVFSPFPLVDLDKPHFNLTNQHGGDYPSALPYYSVLLNRTPALDLTGFEGVVIVLHTSAGPSACEKVIKTDNNFGKYRPIELEERFCEE